MKSKRLLFLLLLATAITACKKEKKFDHIGRITGADLRTCACCGGYYINIDNGQYLMNGIPSNTNFKLPATSYPINVYINFHRDSTACAEGKIIVDNILAY